MPNGNEIIWREIPGFSSYVANSLGQIMHKRLQKFPKVIQVPSSKGTYLRVSALSDNKNFRTKEIHHLVCLAFHGEPLSDDYEVNHKDGDKHNNIPSNLEWMTRSDNLIHAYKEGLRKENRRVIVTDHNTGKVVEYYSMAELGRVFKVTKNSIWALITNHRVVPFNGRYTFEFIKGNTQSTKRATTRLIYALDYKTSTLHVFDNLAELELGTGVKRGTAAWHLKRDSSAILKGFVFSYHSDPASFPTYTDSQIIASMFRAVT
jgi:hypothetical protein